MRDDDSSMVLFFDSTASRPATAHSLKDVRLLAINCPAVAEMLAICKRFRISDEGDRFQAKPTPKESAAALLGWLRQVGRVISSLGLGAAARDAVNPLPPGMKPDLIGRIFVSHEPPDRAALSHLLWCLGISPHAITGALLLLDYSSEKGNTGAGTSKSRRAVVTK